MSYNRVEKPYYSWVESYRPKTLEDIILSKFIKTKMTEIIKAGDITNLLFHGSFGCGKTTMAKMIPELIGFDYMFLTGKSCGIDMLRFSIPQYISNYSLDNKNRKIIIIDEAEKMSDDFSRGFNSFIEEYAHSAAFIITTNYPDQLTGAFRSRFNDFCFDIPTAEERKELFKVFLERIFFILDKENVVYDRKVVQKFVYNYYPDLRKSLNMLQAMSVGGTLDVGILKVKEESFDELIVVLKARKFSKMLEYIEENELTMYQLILDFRRNLGKVEISSVGDLVKLMNDYQYKNVFVPNKDVNLIAFLTEVMVDIIFK